MQNVYDYEPIFISTDSIATTLNLGEEFFRDVRFKKESEGYLTIFRSKLYIIQDENGNLVDCARHGCLFTPNQFNVWINQKTLPNTYQVEKLSTLHDLVLGKTDKLCINLNMERKINWDWDNKRILLNPDINPLQDFTLTKPLPYACFYGKTYNGGKIEWVNVGWKG